MRDDPESSGASGEWLSAAALTCAIKINRQAPPPNRKVAVHVGPGAILIGVLSKLPDDFSSDRLAGLASSAYMARPAAGCRRHGIASHGDQGRAPAPIGGVS